MCNNNWRGRQICGLSTRLVSDTNGGQLLYMLHYYHYCSVFKNLLNFVHISCKMWAKVCLWTRIIFIHVILTCENFAISIINYILSLK